MSKKKEPRAQSGNELRAFVLAADAVHRDHEAPNGRGHWRYCKQAACVEQQTEYERRFVVHKET